MKLLSLIFLLLAALLPLSAPRSAQAADVSFDYFYDALLPYGEWIEVEGYGYCWRPRDVDAAWTPYSDGYWTFTDAGWTWVGYEDFAGIVYHYGRWMSVEGEGWCWVPDYEWGPAWVSWRNSDDYIGWAPLPPRAYWQPEIGISTWADTAYDIGPAFYSFCRVRDFGAPVLRLVLINRTRNVVIIRNTVNITNITYNLYSGVPVIYNGGPSYVVINRRSERPVPALKLVRQTHFDRKEFRGGPGGFSPNARIVGNQMIVNAPIVAAPAQPAFLKDKAKKVFRADKVANGWAGVKDGKEREELRQHFRRETKGLTPYTAPAKAVAAADLKVVPAQADPDAVLPGFAGKGARGKGDRQPPTAVVPAVPGPVTNPAVEQPPVGKPVVVAPAATPVVDPRATAPREHEKGGGKIRGGSTPPVVAAPGQGSVIDPRAAGKTKPDNGRPKSGRDQLPNPVVTLPPDAPTAPANTGVPVEPRDGRASRPKGEAPVGGFHPPGDRRPIAGEGQAARPAGVDPAVAAQAADEAARAAREQAEAQKRKADLEKRGAASVEAAPARIEQERAAKRREGEAAAAAVREKNAAQAAAAAAQKEAREAAEAQRAAQAGRDKLQADQETSRRQRDAEAAAAQQKQMEAQRQAETARQAEQKRQQAEAQSQKQQQEQIAEQRRQVQIEQQKAAAQEAARQAAARAREQQAEQQRAAQEAARQQQKEQQKEQQRAAQDAARQQAAERAREQQMEQQRAAQEAARQQQKEQQRAAQAAAAQAARQQAEAQRAAQEAARQQAPPPPQGAPQQPTQDPRRGEKDKDKDKDKGR